MVDENRVIRGAGKDKGNRTPTEEPDNLNSTQFARVLDLVSEGEIDQYEKVFLDKTDLNNFAIDPAGREFNFGTNNQGPISFDAAQEATTQVNVPVTVSGGPITRTITNTNINRVSITITIPTLQIIEGDGDITGFEVQFQFLVQNNGGGFAPVGGPRIIKGKTSNPFSRTYNILVSGPFPVDIRVQRLSADETSAKRQNNITWTSFTSIIDEKFRYPNSALHFLEFNAQAFNSIPERRFLIRGIKVQIPHNATVDTINHLGRITYSGLFNGTLGAATWTNDPAWCLYDLLRNTRYGCSIEAANLDVFDFFAISQYCNELVSDGQGGQEPRMSLNVVLNTRREVFTAIKELTNVFRGLAYFSSGSFVIKQDKPTDTTYTINPSMVVDGIFEYNGTSIKSRHTCVTVAYQSYDMIGEVQFERVEDADAVRVYGVNHKEVRSIGCYSQGQAQRLGRWILETERYLTQTVNFTVSQDAGVVLSPSMVVSIADPLKTVSRRGGRIHAATLNSITVDSTEDIGSIVLGQNPKISVVLSNGLFQQKPVTAISSPTTASGGEDTTRKTFTVSSNFSQVPSVGGFYGIDTDNVSLEKFRILRVSEEEDGTHSVTALQYDASIYGRVDVAIVTPPTPNPLTAPPNAVTDIAFTTFYYASGATVLIGADVSWTHDGLRTVQYFVDFKIDNDNFQTIITTSPNTTLKNLRTGTLTVRVTAFNFQGGRSTVYEETHTISQNTTPPADVTNFTVSRISQTQAVASWDASTNRDVVTGGFVVIRHSTNTSSTFDTAASLVIAVGSSTSVNLPAINGKYFAVFENINGLQSTTPADDTLTSTAGGSTLILSRKEDTDNPSFQGTFTNTEKYSPPNYTAPVNNPSKYTGIVLQGTILWDSVPDVDALASWDFPINVQSSGEYEFANIVDLEGEFEVLIARRLAFTGFNVSTGNAVTDVDAKIYVATTTGNPSAGATFSAFKELKTQIIKARAFKFKVILTSSNVTSNICVTQLGVDMSMFRRTIFGTGIPTLSSTVSVSFLPDKFFSGVSATIGGVGGFPPSVAPVIQNQSTSGEFPVVTNITGTGFQIQTRDSSGNLTNRLISFQAMGLG